MSSWTPADMASLQPNSSFDGFRQDFVILLPDGTTPTTANLEDFSLLQKGLVNQAVIYGTQIGITALLFLVMLVMTKPDKRRSVVFLLNSLALVFILIRTSMAVRLLGGPFFNFYIFELSWYPYVEEIAYNIRLSVATEVMGVFVNCFIFASLVLQVHIICCTLNDIQHKMVIGFCCLLAVMVCSLRLTLAVMNSMWDIVGLRTVTDAQWEMIQRMASANNIASITCIAIFSAMFNTKLILAILARRKLNMKQFGPMQIIFVMGLQTMFIPFIIGIVAYFVAPGSQLSTFVDTAVAVFLPLSGMWASANTNNTHLANAANRHAVPVGASENSGYYSNPSSGKRFISTNRTDSSSCTDDGDLEKGHGLAVPSHDGTVGRNMERETVRVDRTYQVRLD